MFESARIGIAVALAVETILLVAYLLTRWRERGRVSPWWLLVGPIITSVSLALDAAVETNPEHLRRVTRELLLAVEVEDAPAVAAGLSEHFALSNGLNKTTALAIINRQLSRPLVESNIVNELTVQQAQPNAGRVKLSVTTLLDPEGAYALVRIVRTTWHFDFLRDDDGHYRLARMEMLDLNGEEPIDVFKL